MQLLLQACATLNQSQWVARETLKRESMRCQTLTFSLMYCRDNCVDFDTLVAKPADQRKEISWTHCRIPNLKIHFWQCYTAYLQYVALKRSAAVKLHVAALSGATEIQTQCSMSMKNYNSQCILSQHWAGSKYSHYFPAPSIRYVVLSYLSLQSIVLWLPIGNVLPQMLIH